MKEYTYEIEHSWERQREPVVLNNQHQHQRHSHRHHRCQRARKDEIAMDADALLHIYIKLRNTNNS